jgi:glutamyl-tRNA reductase
VEPEVESLDDIFLYSIDALGDIVKSGYERREDAAVEAEKIVYLRAQEFLHWKSARASAGSVKLFREFGENLIEREYERALHSLQQGIDPEAVLQKMSRSMKNKFLDRPSRVLSAGDTESRETLATALLRLFNLIDPK